MVRPYPAGMPSSASGAGRRDPAAARRPRPPLGRGFAAPPADERPLAIPFAAVFGVLVAAEDLWLAWLLRVPGEGWQWPVAVPVLLAVTAVAGVLLVLLGRGRGWLVLTVASVLPLLGLLVVVLIFGALGAGSETWAALVLLVGPIGCLALTVQRPVREWTRPGRGSRSSGGRRRTVRSG